MSKPFDYLKVKPGQRATVTWANTVVDILNQLYGDVEVLETKGSPQNPFYELYGFYGYFYYDLYVQGKKVIKDEDPINLYDIFPPAKEKITQAVDESRLVEKIEVIRDKVQRIYMDEYGRIGTIITEPLDEYGRIPVSPRDADEDLIPAIGIIDTSTQTSPVEIARPSPGRRIDVRRAYASTNSTGGKVYIKFKNTGKVITVIYPTKYGFAIIPAIRVPGEVDEPVIVEWTGLDTGAEIFYAINYKEI